MNIHEYQAKKLLNEYGIKVPKGELIEDLDTLESKLRRIESDVAVVKAQIHAGGRGKAGGVKVVETISQAIEAAHNMYGKNLVTHQTGPKGQKVRRLYIEEGCDIKKEYYLSMVIDRESSAITIIASSQGGMDIETVAESTPEAITQITIDPLLGICDYQAREIAKAYGITRPLEQSLTKLVKGLYKCFTEKDLSLLEINPLVLSTEDQWVALDAKMSFDENALFRQPDIQNLRDLDEEDPKEVEASAHGLAYVALEGDIACLVNGAGLAMATMDAIEISGGRPANFLDVGGSATAEMVQKAIEIILTDHKVKGIFVNIFGGIMQCDTIANGIVEAMNEASCALPVVVRLEGSNVEKGKAILAGSGLPVISADSMDEGADKIVEMVKEREVSQ